MRNRFTFQQSISGNSSPAQPSSDRSRKILRRMLRLAPSLVLGILLSWANGANAQTPGQSTSSPATTPTQPAPAAPSTPTTPAPPDLTNALAQIDAAANKGDLQAVMAFYSPTFTNSDGLTYATLEQTLKALWQRYPGLTYETKLNSWKTDGNAIEAETTTTVTGTQQDNGRTVKLSSTITSRQRFEGQKIVKQEILTEQSELAQGSSPPSVQVNLPDQVATGKPYEFDAIVTEPLGNRLLLGAALEEPVQAANYLSSTPVNLELLSAGGLFKLGDAANTPGNHWVSAVIIRDDGITTVTRRLHVVNASSAANP